MKGVIPISVATSDGDGGESATECDGVWVSCAVRVVVPVSRVRPVPVVVRVANRAVRAVRAVPGEIPASIVHQ